MASHGDPMRIRHVTPPLGKPTGIASFSRLLDEVLSSQAPDKVVLSSDLTSPDAFLFEQGVNEPEVFWQLGAHATAPRIILVHDPPHLCHSKFPWMEMLAGTRSGRGLRRLLNRIYGTRWERRILRNDDRFVTLSECGMVELQAHLETIGLGHARIGVANIPLYLDIAPLPPRRCAETVIGFFGIITPRKGLDVLIDGFRIAADRLQGTSTALKLLIAGRPDTEHSRRWLEGLLGQRESAGSPHIEFIGSLPEGGIIDFFQQIDILSLPYADRASCAASGPLNWSLTAGRPALVSDTRYFRELFPDGECIVTGGEEAWAAAFERLALQQGFLQSLSLRTNTLRDRFRWKESTEKYLRAFDII